MTRLRRADCSRPGLARRACGRGFTYRDMAGRPVRDPEVVARIRALAIPPAWTDVWICPDPLGHLQAVGTDAAGRRQYLYHQEWRRRRDGEKFERMLAFAQSLPAVRATTSLHLSLSGMPAERALACAVRLADRGFFRIGGEAYAEENNTFGLATMRKEHVMLRDPEVVFEYLAKGGKQRMHSVLDREVFEVVRILKRRRGGGAELLAYRSPGGWRDIRSADINAYLKQVSGGDYSAKDFRTWHATVLAALALAVSVEAACSPTARKRAVARAAGEVAHYLGNTPAVCRTSYIDPRVVDRYESGVTVAGLLDDFAVPAAVPASASAASGPAVHEALERAVIDLLQENSSPAIRKVA